jgi:hypothetical protein
MQNTTEISDNVNVMPPVASGSPAQTPLYNDTNLPAGIDDEGVLSCDDDFPGPDPTSRLGSNSIIDGNKLSEEVRHLNIKQQQVTGSASTDSPIKFQLIPISEIPGRSAIGEVVERTLHEGQHMRIGRQVNKEGQSLEVKGNKKSSDVDVWFTSKVVSRLHCEMWVKDSTVIATNRSFISRI